MGENDLISVIVPVYKVEAYLDRCIESIVNQTYTNLEIILVDDGSPDKCPEICDKWVNRDNRVKVIHKENGGLSSARNVGLNASRGYYIGFVDSDDWIAPDMYEYLLRLLKKEKADYSAIEMKIVNESIASIENPKIKEDILNRDEIIKSFFRVTSQKICYCVCDKLYNRSLLEGVRFLEGTCFEDIDFNYKIIKKANRAIYSNQIKYFWFENYGSITRAELKPRDMQLIEIWKHISEECRKEMPEYYYYAEMNFKRSYLGIMGKSIKYGISDQFVCWSSVERNLLSNLRRYSKDLIKWNMPVSRKLFMISMCVNANFVRKVFKIYKQTIRCGIRNLNI